MRKVDGIVVTYLPMFSKPVDVFRFASMKGASTALHYWGMRLRASECQMLVLTTTPWIDAVNC